MLLSAYNKLVRDYPNEVSSNKLYGMSLGSTVPKLWLSVDSDLHPSLLFETQEALVKSNIELRSISVYFSRYCSFETISADVKSGIYTIVKINECEIETLQVVFKLLEEVFIREGVSHSNREIASIITEIADLFAHVTSSKGDIIGLWGELYILSFAPNLDRVVKYWCTSKTAKYDLVLPDFALEVKSTTNAKRKHRFSLEQVRPLGEFKVYIASLLLVETYSGQTAMELMELLSSKIQNSELRASFLKLCMLKGGVDLGRSSLKLGTLPEGGALVVFESKDMAAPEVKLGTGIENVRFDIDLSNLESSIAIEVGSLLEF
ncbi:hypothetical protein N476_23040 [Pseudoalteromonas luteoviolacea H33]|uniref:PD-(D/E)XK motif protein n=1 Tax=Pseudoalteromonas luteoviolacea H33 TaxID=1365251 RepID=A0A167CI06_9GAMM|nr:hypothetical protein N476_23040 [Pseudoalteromonas luteoviolacea H33]KZN75716.1 hypothetical protein N477_17365 [Pseudoalteromonas luteoviolacea H33-S]